MDKTRLKNNLQSQRIIVTRWSSSNTNYSTVRQMALQYPFRAQLKKAIYICLSYCVVLNNKCCISDNTDSTFTHIGISNTDHFLTAIFLSWNSHAHKYYNCMNMCIYDTWRNFFFFASLNPKHFCALVEYNLIYHWHRHKYKTNE